ncbi:sedoheptulose 7-phosphate cyclase [Catellatospora citrea]|uniref:sedoheptulose 7-phosphate cyclase n=1 Tax=Catellatospora citrea TaxID=53366 RepID=UPI0033C295F4
MSSQLLMSDFETDLARPPAVTWTVQAVKQVSFDVTVARDVLNPDNPALVRAGATGSGRQRRFVVVDAAVDRLYGGRLRAYLDHHGVDHHVHVVEVDEERKTVHTALDIVAHIDEFGIDRRREPVIAIGGGVLLDIVGFVAGTYRRHTPFVRVPTTLIGLVDAGIGVKTGVNFGTHKNRLGTYEAPAIALLDRSFLATVDDRHISNGLAEILKIALIKDRSLFEVLESHGARLIEERLQGHTAEGEHAAREVLRRAVHGMLEELQPNLWEEKLERLVDYGHSFSPSVEMRALPALLHGEAVNVDMALTTLLAWARDMVSTQERDRVFAVMRALRLPIWHPVCSLDLLIRALLDTVRHRDGQQRLPLPVGIGTAAFVNDLTELELEHAASLLRQFGEGR